MFAHQIIRHAQEYRSVKLCDIIPKQLQKIRVAVWEWRRIILHYDIQCVSIAQNVQARAYLEYTFTVNFSMTLPCISGYNFGSRQDFDKL